MTLFSFKESKKCIILSGPTATFKSSFAIKIAKHLKLFSPFKIKSEIINFDSLLFYKELSIGTAKPSVLEMENIPHHLISCSSAKIPLTAFDFAAKAKSSVEEIWERESLPILVGGSGFYLRALINGMYSIPSTPSLIRQKSDELYEKEGISPFIEILHKEDPVSLSRVHLNDHYRLRRRVEHFWSHQTPFSLSEDEFKEISTDLSTTYLNWNFLHLYFNIEKSLHHQIIEKRVDKMIEAGFLEEVKELLQNGFSGNERPLQSIGYKEMIQLLHGQFKDISECRSRIIISTRQLAKSQRTWFKKVQNKIEVDPLQGDEDIFKLVQEFLQAK